MTNTSEVAERIEAARRSAGLTREALADAANIPERTLRRRMASPEGFSLMELITLCRVLEVDIEVIIGDRHMAVAA